MVRMIMLQMKYIGLKFLVEILNGKRRHQEHVNATVAQEFECDFLGSADTLISPASFQTIPFHDPIASNAGLDVYTRAEKDHEYIITVDVARGIGGDYSVFIVFDITTVPYQIVAVQK